MNTAWNMWPKLSWFLTNQHPKAPSFCGYFDHINLNDSQLYHRARQTSRGSPGAGDSDALVRAGETPRSVDQRPLRRRSVTGQSRWGPALEDGGCTREARLKSKGSLWWIMMTWRYWYWWIWNRQIHIWSNMYIYIFFHTHNIQYMQIYNYIYIYIYTRYIHNLSGLKPWNVFIDDLL